MTRKRRTTASPPKTELLYFDESSCTYAPLATSGAIPVIVVGGETGTGGTTMNFLSGSEVPSDDIGAYGDVYLNSTNGDLYKKDTSTWSIIANLKGLKGDRGDSGVDGVDGVDGNTWLFGTGAPTELQGRSGDFYLDTDVYDVYNRNSVSWVKSGNIKGDKGDTGFGTEEQYNNIIARLEALEQAGTT